MPTSEVAFRIFLILLPGFAAAYLAQSLTVRAKQTDLEKIIEAFLFSFMIYITYYVVHPRQTPLLPWGSNGNSPAIFRAGDLLSLLVITIVYAALLILFVEKDGTKYLRKFKVTERTSRSSIWNDVFQGKEQGAIVQIDLADGRSIQGIVRFYSDTAEESSVFLKDARWVDGADFIPVNGPGILLTKEAKILSISFLDPGKD